LAKRTIKEAASTEPKRRGRPPIKTRTGVATTDDMSDNRWTIRGIQSNVRKMAQTQATQRGMTLGDFISEAIIQAVRNPKETHAADITTHTADINANLPAVITADMVTDMFNQMSKRLEALENKREKPLLVRLFGQTK
jgi:hypothetical protein